MLSALSSVVTSNILYYILPQEAIAQGTHQSNGYGNNMLTYENSTYGIRMLYPSNWHKEENVSSASDKNSTLVDIVKFSSHSKNTPDRTSESLDIKVDNISDIKPTTLAEYANGTINDLAQEL
jgi:hypothetical protein